VDPRVLEELDFDVDVDTDVDADVDVDMDGPDEAEDDENEDDGFWVVVGVAYEDVEATIFCTSAAPP